MLCLSSTLSGEDLWLCRRISNSLGCWEICTQRNIWFEWITNQRCKAIFLCNKVEMRLYLYRVEATSNFEAFILTTLLIILTILKIAKVYKQNQVISPVLLKLTVLLESHYSLTSQLLLQCTHHMGLTGGIYFSCGVCFFLIFKHQVFSYVFFPSFKWNNYFSRKR